MINRAKQIDKNKWNILYYEIKSLDDLNAFLNKKL